MHNKPSHSSEADEVRSPAVVIEVWMTDDERFNNASSRLNLRKHDPRGSRTNRTRADIEDHNRLLKREEMCGSITDCKCGHCREHRLALVPSTTLCLEVLVQNRWSDPHTKRRHSAGKKSYPPLFCTEEKHNPTNSRTRANDPS
jgi:hypothetical protein